MNVPSVPRFRRSAGLLLFRRTPLLEVFLVHPGGPFWAKKDDGAWGIPKGEYPDTEDPLAAACREVQEETGFAMHDFLQADHFLPLGEVKQAGGKRVTAWAVECDFDAGAIRSNTFPLEWPPKSGKFREFPEVDQAAWFSPDEARKKILPAQMPFLARLTGQLGINR